MTITNTPLSDGFVQVKVNGSQQILGDGVATKDCYFGNNGFRFDKMTGGSTHSMGLIQGSAWGSGHGAFGQLGQGTVAVNRSSPVSVIGDHSFIDISSDVSSFGLKADGSIWSWGLNDSGHLGINAASTRSSPVSVVGDHNAIAMSEGVASAQSVVLLKADGTAWAWGESSDGKLGDNQASASRSSPISVIGAHSFVEAHVGNDHVTARKTDGSAWGWGWGIAGTLGQGTLTVSRSSPVSVIGDHSFVEVKAGSQHSYGRKSDGTVWAWGVGDTGAIGQGTVAEHRSSPVSVIGDHSFISVSGGFNCGIGLKVDGSLWGWGNNSVGQLGLDDIDHRSSPTSVLVGNFTSIDVADMSFGVTSVGAVWGWGSNVIGALGIQDTANRSSPVNITNSFVLRAIADIQSGDGLIWNGIIAGFELDGTDDVDLDYIA